ncbi:membrane fusion-like protein [Shewanella sp. YIC-542]|uniref:membrane fusion-like protein n=1 Tax=Shewanella mytili TaxID=3377111 RepID=UPI00398F5676
MKWKSLLSSSVLALSCYGAAANELAVAELGNLALAYSPVTTVQQLPASPVPATVAAETGNTFFLNAPEMIQQRHWLVADGAQVTQGQPLILLQGAGVHHFHMQFDAAKAAFSLAQQRYEHNRKLRANGTIGADAWRQISQQYYSAKLQFEHMQHFIKLLRDTPTAQGDAAQLLAPIAGILRYGDKREPLNDGDLLLGVTPLDDIRLHVRLPLTLAATTTAVDTGKCQLTLSRRDNYAQGGFVTAWSEPVTPACQLMLGQQLQVTPLQQATALKVPKQSVYSWGTGRQVLRLSGEKLLPTDVTIVGVEAEHYLLQPQSELQNSQVLSESVAAAKGMLLGLGGE